MRKSGTQPAFSNVMAARRSGTAARRGLPPLALVGCLLLCLGCGTMKTQQATEQLLLSRAVDESIARLDFRPLAGKKVYLDTAYVKPIKGVGFVNADYIISSLRQQLFAAHCLVQEKLEEADYVVEARVGALGADGHEVIYGVPASTQFSTAATLIPNTPVIPPIPEIALAKRNHNLAAAKLAVFAYHRESRTPVWQSGIEVSRSRAKDVWVLGAGPYQSGSIYDKARFAGEELTIPSIVASDSDDEKADRDGKGALTDYFSPKDFKRNLASQGKNSDVRQAGFAKDGAGKEPAKISISDRADAVGGPEAGAADKPAADN
jgi:hypothetical protein